MFNTTSITAWPPRYDTQIIHLMIQSPTVLYAYWEISERRRRMIAAHYGKHWDGLCKVARLLRSFTTSQTGAVESYTDVYVHDTDRWYFRHLEPNVVYQLEYGLLTEDHLFVSLLRSPAIRTPRSEPVLYESSNAADKNDEGHQHKSPAHGTSLSSYDHASPFKQFSTYSLYPIEEGVQK
ncbi:DUF4912 domain-containing protein [Paenibacillus sp. ACRRX]|uniref:DUF4912 domain-containing protein n=1 Tax=Paenibacillus sp. ACRRX TaxID=2918206 RepID=UPI001EF43D3C|nr:DUF4912 domain-containing protein [Paenibacillus sp. ACRRX]MCG7409887.1 DUF4912 domain-containing protein [Paenibacillus sp. ACRRX]